MGTEAVSDGDGSKFDILRARLLLMFGGPLGLHLLYLREPLEAYVYFATFGLSLIAVFYDALVLHSRVAARNKEINIDVNDDRKVKVASTSIIRFIAQLLFGCWTGCLLCLVSVLLLGTGHRVVSALFIASGVSQGVYVVGNCRKQQRSSIYVAFSAFISSLMAILLFDLSLCRTVFFTSLSATFAGNRSMKARNIEKFSFATYLVFSLIHSIIMVIITIGLIRVVFDRRISVVADNSCARVSASLGSVIQDKYFRVPSKDIFENYSLIEYLPSQHKTVFNIGTSRSYHKNDEEKLSIFDYLTVLIIDFMRYNTELSKNMKKKGWSALQLAMWRALTLHNKGSAKRLVGCISRYCKFAMIRSTSRVQLNVCQISPYSKIVLIDLKPTSVDVILNLTPYASDEKVSQECSKYLKSATVIDEISSYWQHKVTLKVCKTIVAIVKWPNSLKC